MKKIKMTENSIGRQKKKRKDFNDKLMLKNMNKIYKSLKYN